MSEYKMVPVEPSLEMISAMIEADWKRPQSMLRGSSNYLASMYQAAVSSVPAVEDKRVAELEAELAEAVSLFKLVMDEHPGKEKDGNAPGHCHQIPGIWDSDNGAKAGKPCAWCAVWNNAHKFLVRHGDRS